MDMFLAKAHNLGPLIDGGQTYATPRICPMFGSRHVIEQAHVKLDAAAHIMKITKPSVLIYGQDPKLMQTRRWVFEQSGFEARTASDIAGAGQTFTSKSLNLFFICHTIPPKERRSAAANIRVIHPGVKVMIVTTASDSDLGGPWQTVDALAGTEVMIVAARRVISLPTGHDR